MKVLGIDIGGSGVKGAVVDTETGVLLSERIRVPTAQPATPRSVAEQINGLVEQHRWDGPIGCGLPGVVQRGVARTAANIDDGWIDIDAEALLSKETGSSVSLINDADAAGLAEMRFGAGRDQKGVVLMVTIGTGIGTALFSDGRLFPNTELGHLMMSGMEAEHFASDRARRQGGLDWPTWAARLDRVLHTYSDLLWPDLIVLGGGVSKKPERYLHFLTQRVPVVTAKLQNEAGIVGAAVYAAER